VSAGLDQWLARVGASTDFREAAELLGELTGLRLGAETIERATTCEIHIPSWAEILAALRDLRTNRPRREARVPAAL
jgi:hypothetical protein